jgi:hypothetical protein
MVPTRRRASTSDDDLREVEANVSVLIAEELVAQHELGGHPAPVPECPICRAHSVRPHRAA